ncbi:hypothetical protein LTR46_009444 [Exophiala xenobiotica]|nr:hypothetical protein LTR46_009444 [Exophiala xenobiotica]
MQLPSLGCADTHRHQGREGYLINGRELTKEQIDDLKRQSREYERQQTIRMSGKPVASTDPAEPDINEPIVVTVPGRRSNSSYSSTSYAPYHRFR